MKKKNYKYIYGPVSSWRIGVSLGIDPVACPVKTCSFDCVYCQIGKTQRLTLAREEFVPVSAIMEEIRTLPAIAFDYITFAGTGEPTLAKNLEEMIQVVKAARTEKIAVITNSTTLCLKEVRRALGLSNLVVAKLDASDDSSLKMISRPVKGIEIKSIVEGLMKFREEYSGKLAVQIMFVEGNKGLAKDLASLVNAIRPDEVQINTPLRPCAAAPLSKDDILKIKDVFVQDYVPNGITVKSVYDPLVKKKAVPISSAETIRRRGKPV